MGVDDQSEAVRPDLPEDERQCPTSPPRDASHAPCRALTSSLVSAVVNRSSTPGRATRRRLFFALLLAWLPLACSRDSGHARRDGTEPGNAAQRYEAADVRDGGTVVGTVELADRAPPDTTIHPASDVGVCGRSFPLRLVDSDGRGIGRAVVWLDDARRGKPLPVERRYTLTNERCLLSPPVQAVIAGGTLNVRSVDAAVHRNRFLRLAEDTTLAKVQLNDEGQVVPLERILVQPGRIEVRCDQHPWTRAWLMVFDHPYFATTGQDGAFRMDSVPAGEYRLVVWHPRLGETELQVTVKAGRDQEVHLTLGR
jgi:hypothetical protein